MSVLRHKHHHGHAPGKNHRFLKTQHNPRGHSRVHKIKKGRRIA